MNKPFFSIVMANFNSGKYLEQALLSVLNQSCQDFEIIVVDGGSTDNSIEVIKKYANHFAWWVSEPDKGQSDAFNKGFAHATGKYYTWLNADDLLLPGALQRVKKYAEEKGNREWIAINTCYIDKDDRISQCSVCTDYSHWVLKHGYVNDIGPSSFFTAGLFETYGPFDVDNHYVMDCDLWQRFIIGGYRYYRVSGWGWAFRVHELSKTSAGIKGHPSEGQIKARQMIKDRNHFEKRRINILFQILKKVLCCSLKRWILNKKYVGMNINLLQGI